ncbi:hypothetical protein Nepgr_008221 [Nepenthes gracilis]|uniref:Uncharacterized protein n=1 Tax=Nepenthes gracilis TaxID=150966 RepID=A0AAD3S9D0_NEPGR|nr:hypothetical protein Nepgr_008221 [Nepenthes gracilis]
MAEELLQPKIFNPARTPESLFARGAATGWRSSTVRVLLQPEIFSPARTPKIFYGWSTTIAGDLLSPVGMPENFSARGASSSALEGTLGSVQ